MEMRAATKSYAVLYGFNALVVSAMASFFYMTSEKIVRTYQARDFLERVDALPMPAGDELILLALLFFALLGCSLAYRRMQPSKASYALLALEVATALFLLRLLHLAYDGILLLVAVDLMAAYRGRYPEFVLIVTLFLLYTAGNAELMRQTFVVVPFEAYLAYYDDTAQGMIRALFGFLRAVNLILFVYSIYRILREQSEEKEEILRLNEELAEANFRLRAYALEAEAAAETRERNRLAREIHDTIGHVLTGLAASLDACIATFRMAPEFTEAELPKLRETTAKGIRDIRRSVKKLRPETLDELSFEGAIRDMVTRYAEQTGMEIALSMVNVPPMRADMEDTIYRIAQEGMTNAHRHGKATRVNLTIARVGEKLHVGVHDNGMGSPVISPDFGLRHMKERVEILGGSIVFSGQDGFLIEAVLPVE